MTFAPDRLLSEVKPSSHFFFFSREWAHTKLRDPVVEFFTPNEGHFSCFKSQFYKFNWVGHAVHPVHTLRLLGTQDGPALNIRRFSLGFLDL